MANRGDKDGFESEEEYVPLNVPEEYRHIDAQEDKWTVRQLWDEYTGGRLIVEPDFQREYVWDPVRASRYVESLLLNLPTPPIFTSDEQDGTLVVIDGHQRLETLFRFMQPLLKGPAEVKGVEVPWRSLSPLTLRSLEVMPEFNGRGITSLSIDDREKLWQTKLNIIRLPVTTHPDMKYALFARLNQGSMSLNNQELRNCLYRGPYNKLIAQLSEDRAFLRLWDVSTPDKRMRHRELVLRFFAFLHRADRYRPPLRAFLSDEMIFSSQLDDDAAALFQQQFNTALVWVDRIFGKEAFRLFRIGSEYNPVGIWTSRRLELVYEVEMVGFAQFGEAIEKYWKSIDIQEQQLFRTIMRHKLLGVMTSQQFVASLSQGTTRPDAVAARFEPWNRTLQALALEPDEALVEADLLKEGLRETPSCALCSYPVIPDDAVWARIDDKPRLVHRFCQVYRLSKSE